MGKETPGTTGESYLSPNENLGDPSLSLRITEFYGSQQPGTLVTSFRP